MNIQSLPYYNEPYCNELDPLAPSWWRLGVNNRLFFVNPKFVFYTFWFDDEKVISRMRCFIVVHRSLLLSVYHFFISSKHVLSSKHALSTKHAFLPVFELWFIDQAHFINQARFLYFPCLVDIMCLVDKACLIDRVDFAAQFKSDQKPDRNDELIFNCMKGVRSKAAAVYFDRNVRINSSLN